MIQARASVLTSPTSIQPDKRVMTMGALSEFFRSVRPKLRVVICIDVVELVMAVSFLVYVAACLSVSCLA
jgi:hypothetical protein